MKEDLADARSEKERHTQDIGRLNREELSLFGKLQTTRTHIINNSAGNCGGILSISLFKTDVLFVGKGRFL